MHPLHLMFHPTINLFFGKKQIFQVALEPLRLYHNQPALGVGSLVAQLRLTQNLVVNRYNGPRYRREHLGLIALAGKPEAYIALLYLLSQRRKEIFIHRSNQFQAKIIKAKSYAPAILHPGPTMTAVVVVVVRHLVAHDSMDGRFAQMFMKLCFIQTLVKFTDVTAKVIGTDFVINSP